MNAQAFRHMIVDEGVEAFNAWRLGHNEEPIELQNANLKGLYMEGINLSGVNLQGANLSHTRLMSANLRWAKLQGADFTFAHAPYCNLALTHLQEAVFDNGSFAEARFFGANLSYANLQHGSFYDADFRNTVLVGVNLAYARMDRVLLNDAVGGAFYYEYDLFPRKASLIMIQGHDKPMFHLGQWWGDAEYMIEKIQTEHMDADKKTRIIEQIKLMAGSSNA